MSEKVGVSQQYYNKFEKGTGQPNLETLWRIRHVLEEPLDFIIGYNFEDIKADQLYELYAEARRRREETEEDIDYSENESTSDIEIRMQLLKRYREELKMYKAKEEKSFNMFFDHISTIPGFEGEFSRKEYWIEKYPSYQENDKQLYHEFMNELHELQKNIKTLNDDEGLCFNANIYRSSTMQYTGR